MSFILGVAVGVAASIGVWYYRDEIKDLLGRIDK